MGRAVSNQSDFTIAVAKLIGYMHSSGYEVTFGDAWALPGKGRRHKKNSKHYNRLAIDLNIFLNGKYMSKTIDHEVFGHYWEAAGGIWGGRFRDGNHYEWPY